MKLKTWATNNGVSYRTALGWFHAGKLPVPARQLDTGTILVDVPGISVPVMKPKVALYARVSGHDQKADLDRQLSRLLDYALKHDMEVVASVKEIGSGLNGRCKELNKLLQNPAITRILVEHGDRLMRFGLDYVVSTLASQNRSVVIVDPVETTDDIVQDMHDLLTSLCARLYGKRSAKNRASKALQAIKEGVPDPAEVLA